MSAFATTRWSLILEARAESGEARIALDRLCSAYRAPVLAFIRKRGIPRERAEDLTQEFFERFLAQRIHAGADPARGRFRSFLLGALRHFLSDSEAAAATAKRGGRHVHESLDVHEPVGEDDTPERAFEKRWALTVLARAMSRLRREADQAGKRALFDALQEFLLEQPARSDYQRVSEQLGLRRNTLAVAVHRMRERLRELVRIELADTVVQADDVDDELLVVRRLLGATVV